MFALSVKRARVNEASPPRIDRQVRHHAAFAAPRRRVSKLFIFGGERESTCHVFWHEPKKERRGLEREREMRQVALEAGDPPLNKSAWGLDPLDTRQRRVVYTWRPRHARARRPRTTLDVRASGKKTIREKSAQGLLLTAHQASGDTRTV